MTSADAPEPTPPTGAPFGAESHFAVAEGVEAARHVDGLTLKQPATGVYFSLDGTGLFIWELLNENKSLAEVKKVAQERFGAAVAEIEATVDAFVGDLLKERLLTTRSD